MLGLMAKEFFAQSPLMVFPLAALFLFIVVFSVLSVRALFRPKQHIQQLSMLPFDQDNDLHSEVNR